MRQGACSPPRLRTLAKLSRPHFYILAPLELSTVRVFCNWDGYRVKFHMGTPGPTWAPKGINRNCIQRVIASIISQHPPNDHHIGIGRLYFRVKCSHKGYQLGKCLTWSVWNGTITVFPGHFICNNVFVFPGCISIVVPGHVFQCVRLPIRVMCHVVWVRRDISRHVLYVSDRDNVCWTCPVYVCSPFFQMSETS